MLRLFIAIELPPVVQTTLQKVQADLRRHGLAVRWVDPSGTHLTLKFLGATPPEQVAAISAALADVTGRQRPFTLTTAGLGCFPNRRAPRVIWLGLAGALPALGLLRDDVERTIAPLGFPTEQRPFSPHLTLGRTHKDASRQEIAAIGPTIAATAAPAPLEWPVHEVSLMRSDLGPDGARYTQIALASLATI